MLPVIFWFVNEEATEFSSVFQPIFSLVQHFVRENQLFRATHSVTLTHEFKLTEYPPSSPLKFNYSPSLNMAEYRIKSPHIRSNLL